MLIHRTGVICFGYLGFWLFPRPRWPQSFFCSLCGSRSLWRATYTCSAFIVCFSFSWRDARTCFAACSGIMPLCILIADIHYYYYSLVAILYRATACSTTCNATSTYSAHCSSGSIQIIYVDLYLLCEYLGCRRSSRGYQNCIIVTASFGNWAGICHWGQDQYGVYEYPLTKPKAPASTPGL